MESKIEKWVLSDYYRWAVTGWMLIILAILLRTLIVPYGVLLRGWSTTKDYYTFEVSELTGILNNLKLEDYDTKVKEKQNKD